jgi:hypothetical protein
MKHEYIVSVIAITIVSISGFVSYNTLEDKRLTSLEKSLESASSRGINPVAVRCAYASSNDNICIVYAAKQVTVKE